MDSLSALPAFETTAGQKVDWNDPQWKNPDRWIVSMDDTLEYIMAYESQTGRIHPYHASRLPNINQIYRECYKDSIDPVKEVDSFFKKTYSYFAVGSLTAVGFAMKYGVVHPKVTIPVAICGGTLAIAHGFIRSNANYLWNNYFGDVLDVNLEKIDHGMIEQKLAEHDAKIGPCPKIATWEQEFKEHNKDKQ